MSLIYEFDLLLLKVLLLLEQGHPFHLALETSLQRCLKDDKLLVARYHDAVQKSKVALYRSCKNFIMTCFFDLYW